MVLDLVLAQDNSYIPMGIDHTPFWASLYRHQFDNHFMKILPFQKRQPSYEDKSFFYRSEVLVQWYLTFSNETWLRTLLWESH